MNSLLSKNSSFYNTFCHFLSETVFFTILCHPWSSQNISFSKTSVFTTNCEPLFKNLSFYIKKTPVATGLRWLAGLAGLAWLPGLGLLSLLYGSGAAPKGRPLDPHRILYGWRKTYLKNHLFKNTSFYNAFFAFLQTPQFLP